MKVTTSPSASVISLRTALSRSSNSPRYLAPATIDPRSSAMTRLPFSPSGTSPSMIRLASPSTMAVLPTPGSPISTGLFLVRRESTWITRRISSSRPMTGSSLPVAGGLGEVAPVLGQRLVRLLGIGRRHPVVAPHGPQSGEQRVLGDADVVGQGQQEVLDRDVVVPQLAPDLVCRLEHVSSVAGQAGLGAALGPRQAVQLLAHLVGQRVGVHADLGQHGPGHRLLLRPAARRAGAPTSSRGCWPRRRGRWPR